MVQPITLKGYAEKANLDPDKLLRTLKRHKSLPEPVGEANGVPTYDPSALDAARGIVPGQVTLDEYAAMHGLSPTTVRHTWPVRYADIWPTNAGKRGRTHTYWESDLDRVRRRSLNLPDPQGSPEDMLTWEGVCAYLAPMTARATMEWRRSRRLWEAGEVGADGAERWRRGRVEELQAQLSSGG